MSSDRHERAAELFVEASELPEAERQAWLERACGGDRELLEEVLELLAYDTDPLGPIPHDPAAPGDTPSSAFVKRLEEQRPPSPRYRFVGEIARGGMGAILKVWDKALGRQLAMKVVLGQASAGRGETPPVPERLLVRFLDEAKITGQLDHPGIVPVHELGVDDLGRVFFTMRLVKGETLLVALRRLRAGEPEWSRARALGVLLKVCEAMAFAHAHGVVHRDLKPANVMVGRFGEVYVMDWGLGRVVGQHDGKDIRLVVPDGPESAVLGAEGTSELVTRDGDVVGTPSYMAPEQARGELDRIGARSDVYSAGAILYDLLAGHPPYADRAGERAAGYAVYRMLLEGPPTPLERAGVPMPPELVAICEKAMARDPAARYADMQEMARDVRAFLEDRVVRAHRTGARVELTKWVRRNRGAAAGLATALLALLLAGALYAWQERRRSRAVGELYEERLAESVLARLAAPVPIRPESIATLQTLVEQAQWLLARGRARGIALPPAPAELPPSAADLPYPLQVDHTYATGFAGILAANREALASRAPDDPDRARLEEDVLVLTEEVPYREQLFLRHLEDERLRALLEGPGASDPRVAFGARLRAIERRLPRARDDLELARGLRARTLEEPAERWRACARSIADPAQCPAYEGLELEPVLGLVPLRRDPGSGLWEFLHVLSGEAPAAGPDGRWTVRPETGVVLVLVPGAERAVLGVEREGGTPERHPDPGCLPQEGPLRTVALAPCFLAKHELTQAQWFRLTGDLPSEHFAGASLAGGYARLSRAHPVEGVSCEEAETWLARWSLALPTEAQWEHAARAGGAAPFGASDEPAALQAVANVADRSYAPFYPAVEELAAWDDGFPLHAPVGSFAPNAYGLFDAQGNVSEWTRDWHCQSLGDRDVARVVPGSGELVPPYAFKRTFRGSSFKSTGRWLRLSFRPEALPRSVHDGTGVRPCIDLPGAAQRR